MSRAPGLPEDADALLCTAWNALGGQHEELDRLDVTGRTTGHLPSAVPSYQAMLAAVASATVAVSTLDAARQRATPAPVAVDGDHVAVAAHSERHACRSGLKTPPSFAPLSRFWRTRDGQVRTHANYPWHRDRALAVLGCTADPAQVERAMLERTTVELENSFADAGALAVGIRSPEQWWQQHPQGRAVGALPLLTRTRQGKARPLPPGRALAGIRVLDLTRVIAGPVATRTLAAWGADVLRIDSPHLPENEDQCLDTLVGKRSALLDISTAAGRARLETLLSQADVLVQGYRPGALARYGLGSQDLAVTHPHLTVVTLSAWGEVGPWAGRRGFDSLVQAASGLAVLESQAPGQPGVLPAQVLDHATGYLAAAAATLSLADVTQGLPPVHTTLSLAQTSAWLTSVTPTSEAGRGDMTPADPWLATVPGLEGSVTVVAPPGALAGRRPQWSRTTRFGADAPAFLWAGQPDLRPRP